MEKDLTIQVVAMRVDKKRWENPTLVVIDPGNVAGGPINAVTEKTTPTAVNLPGFTSTNHS
ncbi:hypothetical protein ACFGVR_23510 [Mucilaginibacter sp. AW1-3]